MPGLGSMDALPPSGGLHARSPLPSPWPFVPLRGTRTSWRVALLRKSLTLCTCCLGRGLLAWTASYEVGYPTQARSSGARSSLAPSGG